MTYIIIFLIFMTLYFLYKSHINKYSWFFVAIVFSLIGILLSSFMLISASGKYENFSFLFTDFDFTLFTKIAKFKPKLSFTMRFFNICNTTYFLSSVFFARSYLKEDAKVKTKRWVYLISVFAFPVIYAVFYDPAVLYIFFRTSHTFDTLTFYHIVCIINVILIFGTYIYITAPMWKLFSKSNGLNTLYKKKQIVGIRLFVLFTDVLYVIMLHISKVRYFYDWHDPLSLIKIRIYGTSNWIEYVICVVVMILTIFLIFYLFRHFNIIRFNGIISRYLLKKHTKAMKSNMLGAFHGVKNIIYSYKILCQQAMCAEGEEKNLLLKQLNSELDSYLASLSSLLDQNNTICDFEIETVYISDLIDETLKDFSDNTSVKFIRNYIPKIEKIECDQYHLKEAFKNIIQNSIEAINQKNANSDGVITISIMREFEHVFICFEDNGIGMNSKIKKNIFKPFYSTKSFVQNWGIGLSYVEKIIKMHSGNISIKSAKNKGTQFYVLMPLI